MENPFKQLVPDEEPPRQEVKNAVMGNIYVKNFLLGVMEMFTAILGLTIFDSVAARSDEGSELNKRKKRKDDNEPNFFF